MQPTIDSVNCGSDSSTHSIQSIESLKLLDFSIIPPPWARSTSSPFCFALPSRRLGQTLMGNDGVDDFDGLDEDDIASTHSSMPSLLDAWALDDETSTSPWQASSTASCQSYCSLCADVVHHSFPLYRARKRARKINPTKPKKKRQLRTFHAFFLN